MVRPGDRGGLSHVGPCAQKSLWGVIRVRFSLMSVDDTFSNPQGCREMEWGWGWGG